MKKIGVLGTGTMGAGIIQVCAQKGYEVVMRARRETSVEKGLATVKKNLDKMVAKGKMEQADADKILGKIKTGLNEICADADLVVEAALEVMDIKKNLFKELEENLTCYTILGSSFFEQIAELALKNSVSIFCLLLLSEHKTILRLLAATVVSVLSCWIIAL